MSKARLLADLISDSQITASEITGLELNAIQQGDTVVEVSDTGSGGKVVVRVDGVDNSEFNAGGLKVPSGTTAQRDPAAAIGSLRYNTTTGFFETLTVSGWGSVATPPSITSITPSNFDGAAGATFTVNGAFFDTATTAAFKGADGTEYAAATVTYVNSTQITVTNATNLPVANEPFKVSVTNGAGLSVDSTQAIDAGSVPSFTTAAGSLATTARWDEAVSVTVNATDAENTISGYAITQGNLPPGLSLNTTTGAITGTSSNQATTTYTFTIGATDSAGNTNTRQFNIQIVNAAPVWSSPAEGSTEELSVNSSATFTLNASDPEGEAVSYTSGVLPAGLGLSGNTISGTPSVPGTTSVAVTASDGSASTVRNFFINVNAPLFSFSSFTFNTAGASGAVGASASSFANAYSGQSFMPNYFQVAQNGFQIWTVPTDGTYKFRLKGARGGDDSGATGGYGADIVFTKILSKNQQITILCGHHGGVTSRSACDDGPGGGGASAVILKSFTAGSSLINSDILAVAGGGGGVSSSGRQGYSDAATVTGVGEFERTGSAQNGDWGRLLNDNNQSSNGAGIFDSGPAHIYRTNSISSAGDMFRASPPSAQPNQQYGGHGGNSYSESGWPLQYGWRGGYSISTGCQPLAKHGGGFGGGGGACHPGGGGGGYSGGSNGRWASTNYGTGDQGSSNTQGGGAGSSYIQSGSTFVSGGVHTAADGSVYVELLP